MGLRHPLRGAVTVLVAAMPLAFAPSAAADVYKCVAAGGRVTYQQAPCPPGTTGGRTDIVVDNGSSQAGSKQEKEWEDAVKAKNVTVGMPRNYVVRALGQPPEVGVGSTADNATEIWSYPQGSNVLRIGMTGGIVTWERLDPSDAALAAAAAAPTHLVELRKSVVPGIPCAQVIADLGPPDLDEAETVGQPYRKLTWGATQEDPSGTMFVTCRAGLVTEARREAQ